MVEEEFLTSEEVCALLHINRPSVYRWAREGKLKPCSKIGRRNFYRKSDIVALLDPERAEHDGASKVE